MAIDDCYALVAWMLLYTSVPREPGTHAPLNKEENA
jgi:hypothetical protein